MTLPDCRVPGAQQVVLGSLIGRSGAPTDAARTSCVHRRARWRDLCSDMLGAIGAAMPTLSLTLPIAQPSRRLLNAT